jgi:cytochrome P450
MTTPIDWPRGPAGTWIAGNLGQHRRDPLGFLTECARRYGDFVPLRFGPVRAVLVSHPDLIEEVLVTKNRHFVKHGALRFARRLLGDGLLTLEGEAWRRRRRLVQPAFHRERIACHAEAMVAAAERMMDGWADGQALDAHAAMTHLTLEVAATCLFGADLAADADAVSAAVDRLQRYFRWRLSRLLAVPLFVPTPYHLRIWRAGLRLLLTVRRITAGRRAANPRRDDLLATLLDARGDDGGAAMTGRQVREEAMTLLLAGYETTANTLAWSWYLLARNLDAEARLHEEVDQVLGDRSPTFDDLPRLEYAGAIITEALRVYPPAYAIGRQAASPCEMGGHRVPRGTTFMMSQWVVHRDPRFYNDPEEFRPERWAGGLAGDRPRYAYFPFGGGPRVCVGSSFALTEATLVLAAVAQRFRLAVRSGRDVRSLPTMTLRPADGLEVVVTRRTRIDEAGPQPATGAAAGPFTGCPAHSAAPGSLRSLGLEPFAGSQRH